MHEVAEMEGACTICCKWFPDLRRWRVSVVDGAPLERLWVCQGCRDLPRDEITRQLRWNISNLPDGWDDNHPGFAPSVQELGDRRAAAHRPHLRLVPNDDR
jgi:hypothetical protein